MFKKSTLSAAVALGLGGGPAHATEFFITYMDFPGSPNNTVIGTVDTNAGTGTFTSGATPFFGHAWTGTVTYGDETSGAGSWNYSIGTGASATGTYNYTLADGQVAMGILFDWGTSSGIPVLNIMNVDGSGVDIDGDGTLGTTMAAGPFAGSPVGFAGMPVIPLPEVTIQVPGGTPQECKATNGSNMDFNAVVTVSDEGEVYDILWFLDGGNTPVASGVSVNIFVPLGKHTVDVTMSTLTMGSVSSSTSVTVEDTVEPVIDAAFTDIKTGDTIISVEHKATVKVLVRASDVCDQVPTIMSGLGIPVQDSDIVEIKANKKDSGLTLVSSPNTGKSDLSVVATDASGNTAVKIVTLPVSR